MLTQSLPQAATDYAREQRLEQQAALAAVRRQWRRMDAADFDRSWATIAPTVVAIVATAQQRVADSADAYIPAVLVETGQERAAEARALTTTAEWVGWTGAGVTVADSLAAAPIRAKQARQGTIQTGEVDGRTVTTYSPGKTGPQALALAGNWLTASIGTILSDTARSVEAVGMYTRPVGGYVRMLNPPSCARCAILAGRFYRKNAGFDRHPGCDCRHIPASEAVAGDLRLNVSDYYDSLDDAGKLQFAGSKANAQAIADGADPAQIVNAYRRTAGMRFAQVSPIKREFGNKYTTEGATRRALAFQQQTGLRRNGRAQARLMPESIYRNAASQEDAIRQLKLYGWIHDDAGVAAGRATLADVRRAERSARARARRAESAWLDD